MRIRHTILSHALMNPTDEIESLVNGSVPLLHKALEELLEPILSFDTWDAAALRVNRYQLLFIARHMFFLVSIDEFFLFKGCVS